MEAFAVLKAIAKQRDEGFDARVAIMKGISDLKGNESAQNEKVLTQKVATKNALTVVLKLLRHFKE